MRRWRAWGERFAPAAPRARRPSHFTRAISKRWGAYGAYVDGLREAPREAAAGVAAPGARGEAQLPRPRADRASARARGEQPPHPRHGTGGMGGRVGDGEGYSWAPSRHARRGQALRRSRLRQVPAHPPRDHTRGPEGHQSARRADHAPRRLRGEPAVPQAMKTVGLLRQTRHRGRGRRRREAAEERAEPHTRPDWRTLASVTRRDSRVHSALFRILLDDPNTRRHRFGGAAAAGAKVRGGVGVAGCDGVRPDAETARGQ